MDIGADDELDYEEDGIESDLLKNNSESMNYMGNEVNLNENFTSCEEDYLQINCSDEEEIFVSGKQTSEAVISEEAQNIVSERPSKTVSSEKTAEETVEAQKVQKANEQSRIAKTQRIFKGKNVRTLTNQLNDFNHNNCNDNKRNNKKKKRPLSFPRRSAVKKKLTNSLTLNPWLPEYDFLEAGDVMKPSGVALCNSQLPRWQGNSPTSRKATVPLPAFDAFQQEQNLQQGQQQMADNKRQNEEDLGQNCRVDEAKGDFRNTTKAPHVRSDGGILLNKCGWKYEAESPVSFLSERKKCPVQIHALKDDEKELVKLKKEARRKRFMQDVIIKKEKEPFESNVAKKSANCLPNDSSKMGEAKLLKAKFQPRGNQDSKNDHDSLLEKTNLKKELLLKKRNPFDGRVEMTAFIAGTKIKQEVLCHEGIKAEYAESTLLKETEVEKQSMENDKSKVLGGLRSNDPGLFRVKNETSSQVTFVRTISRSLNELGFGRAKTGVVSEGNEDCTFEVKALPFVKEEMQEQVTSQLTGCIVKVLNIPPSTTTNDILSLCSGIGIVREVKLNFPKENSAAIRFAEPSSAENFFSLYHGQKMNNYFLNVIII